jgi:hypothetical protein
MARCTFIWAVPTHSAGRAMCRFFPTCPEEPTRIHFNSEFSSEFRFQKHTYTSSHTGSHLTHTGSDFKNIKHTDTGSETFKHTGSQLTLHNTIQLRKISALVSL